MDRATRTVLLAAAIVGVMGCAQWQHAPGYAERGTMVKQELRVATGSACHFGACDKKGPTGPIRFSNVWFLTLDGSRTSTRFDVAYAGSRAQCKQTPDPKRPFMCVIAEADGTSYKLELDTGCTGGTISRTGTETQRWSIQTDTVAVGGHVAPGREVSLIDDFGVVTIADALTSDNLDVFTRRGAALATPQLLGLVGVQAFLQLDDLPSQCLTST